jgi:hypothetical protein
MNNEKIQQLKFIMIGSVVIVIIGYVAGILLSRAYPVLGNTLKLIIMGIGGLGFAGGIIWMIAGDTLTKKKTSNKTYEEQMKDIEEQIKLTQLQTRLKLEEANQKEIENKLKLQDIKLNAVKNQAMYASQQNKPGGSSDMLDRLGGLVKPQNTGNDDMLGRLSGTMNRPSRDIDNEVAQQFRPATPRQEPRHIPRYANRPVNININSGQRQRIVRRRPVMDEPPRPIDDFSEFKDITIKKKNMNDGFF